jgi:murein DD-endopeptidase MepM/ murein hydrolase activator NlpD
MKKIFLFLLIVLPVYLLASLYFLDKDYFLSPIEYKVVILVRCDSRGNGFFGADRKGKRLHQGIDLFAEIGTPVLASRSGAVIVAKGSRGMGNYVIVRHPAGLITIYGHLSAIYVSKGQFVRQGEIIGAVGKTGNAQYRDIQPHLHFEVRKNGVPQDPLGYLQ